MLRISLLLMLYLLLACAQQTPITDSGQAAVTTTVFEGADVLKLNWDIHHDSSTMHLSCANQAAGIHFSRHIEGPCVHITGSWHREWRQRSGDNEIIHNYLFDVAPDGTCCYREQQGTSFVNIYGAAETVFADVYIAHGRWRQSKDNHIYIVFDQTKTITPLRVERLDAAVL